MGVLIPLTCFPDNRLLALLSAGQPVKIEVCDRYERQSLRNRYSISGSQGKLDLSIPITLDETRMYSTARINYRESWARSHWRSITSCYNKAPYFIYYADAVEQLLFSGEELLQKFNLNALHLLCMAWKIQVPELTTEWKKDVGEGNFDLRIWSEPASFSAIQLEHYNQVFEEKTGFVQACSGLDLLFNYGPDGIELLRSQYGKISTMLGKID
jgi:hypothetical protein